MTSGFSFEAALAGAYLLLFGLTYAISRLGLRLAGKFRAHWYVIVGVHIVSLGITALAVSQLTALIFSRLPTDFYYFDFSRGCLLYTQVLLLAGDLLYVPRRRLNVLVIAALVAAAVGYLSARLNPYPFMKPAFVDGLLEERLAQAIANGSTNNALIVATKGNFPVEYQTMLATYRKSLREAASASAQQFTKEYYLIDKDFLRDVRQLVVQHREDIEHAPDRVLYNVAETQLAALEAAGDPRICAAMVGGSSLSPALSAEPSAHEEDIAARNALAAKVVAARLGVEHPVERDPATISKAVQLKYTRELYKAMKREEIPLIGHVEQMKKADVRIQCDVGIGIYHAVLRLPPSEAAQLVAYMVAHS